MGRVERAQPRPIRAGIQGVHRIEQVILFDGDSGGQDVGSGGPVEQDLIEFGILDGLACLRGIPPLRNQGIVSL